MPLDPQAQAMLERFAGAKPLDQMTVQEMRDGLELRARLTAGPPEAVAQIRAAEVPGPSGPIPVRIYTPANAAAPAPAMVYFHGGGWVRGSLDTIDVVCRALANRAGCVVISVDYRLAPEHVFPAAVDDSLAATRWVAAHTAELGVDRHRLAVGGDSAGGNLAAAVAQVLRDAGGPPLVYQLLIYPVLDRNFDTPSYRDNATGYSLTRAAMQQYWQMYQPDPAQDDDPRARPLRAADLSGLPPTLVITAEFDPLRDEGRAYAEALQAAGVPAQYREYPGLIHGFVSSAGAIDRGKDAIDAAAAALRHAFAATAVATAS